MKVIFLIRTKKSPFEKEAKTLNLECIPREGEWVSLNDNDASYAVEEVSWILDGKEPEVRIQLI
jgi:hypothetical protein